jgi:phage/plasmid-like protein (TIGR03299 family)
MHAVENMMSVRQTPWHSIGQVLPAYPKSKQELLEAAGLDWSVGEFPVRVQLPSGTVLTPLESKAIVRRSDEKLLSIMGGTYQAIQPAALVDFAFSILDVTQNEFESADGEPPILFETACSLYEGRVNTLLAKVPQNVMIGGVDPVDLYLSFVTSHDGSHKFGVHVTPVRVVCANTLAMSLKRAAQSWSFKHTANATNSIDEARCTLKLTWAYKDEFEARMNDLIASEFMKREFEEMVRALWPKPANEPAPFSKEQYAMIGLLESSPTIPDEYRYTRWGALNAITEHLDWGTRFTQGGPPVEEKRAAHVLFGRGKQQSERALNYLLAA